jgi:8-oxo-dGTP pyrophosphatase MutT (NUDIX family)/MFS family permease
MMIWAVPAVIHMIGFQLRGKVNMFKKWLSQHVRVYRGGLAVIIATLSVNIPFHIRGALNAAVPDANRLFSALFGVTAMTTVIGALALLAASIASRDLPERWNRFVDRLVTLGAAATLTAIPYMVWAVFVHPDFDGVVTIHPVVLALVVATFAGFGGEAALHLAGVARKLFGIKVPARWSEWYVKLTTFFTVFSAVTVGAYGMLYQLNYLQVLIPVTAGSLFVGLLLLVFTRPHLGRGDKARHAVIATVLTAVDTLAVGALFLGWPQMSTGSAIVSTVLGAIATVVWAWTIRDPPGSGPNGPALSDGPTSPDGGFLPGTANTASDIRHQARTGAARLLVAAAVAALVHGILGAAVAGPVVTAVVMAVLVAGGVVVAVGGRWLGPVVRSLRGRLVGAGSARSPPGDADELRVAVGQLQERVGADDSVWMPRQQKAHRRLLGALSRILAELDAGAGEARAAELLGRASKLLVQFDRWVPAGRVARWRLQLRRSHRWSFVSAAALAIGVSAAGVFGTPVLSAGVVGAPDLFTPGMAGFLVGLATVGPWWGYLERRWLAVASLGLTGVGFGMFGLSGMVPGFAVVAAVLLGFAGAGYVSVQARASEWITDTTEARRGNGDARDPARLSGGVVALMTLGFATASSLIFVVLKPLLAVSPVVAALPGVALSAAAVAALWVTMPAELPNRKKSTITRSKNLALTVLATTGMKAWEALKKLRNPLVLLTTVVMGAANLVSGAWDAFWRKGYAENSGGGLWELVLNFGLVGSAVLLVGLVLPAELGRSRGRGPATGEKKSLLTDRPAVFLLVMAGALSGGAVAALVTALTGNPLLGIGIGVFSNAMSVTGMGLGVNAILKRYLPEEERASALTVVSLVRAVANIGGSLLGGMVFAGSTPLPTGWTGVVVQNLVPGLLAFGAAILLWRHVSTLETTSSAQTSSTRATTGVVDAIEPTAGIEVTEAIQATEQTPPGTRSRLAAWLAARLGPFSWARGLGYVGSGVVTALVLFSGPFGVLVAVAAGVVSPVLLMLMHHVWTHGPPWVPRVVKALVVVGVILAVLTLAAGSAASADTGTPGGPNGHGSDGMATAVVPVPLGPALVAAALTTLTVVAGVAIALGVVRLADRYLTRPWQVAARTWLVLTVALVLLAVLPGVVSSGVAAAGVTAAAVVVLVRGFVHGGLRADVDALIAAVRREIATVRTWKVTAHGTGPGVFGSLKEVPAYRNYAIGYFVALVGIGARVGAQAWLILELTGEAAWAVALVGAVQFAPTIPLSLWAGLLADRFDKRRILLVTQLVSVAATAALAVLVLSGSVQLWQIVLVTLVVGVTATLENPARETIVAEIVGEQRQNNAFALNTTISNAARVLGPVLGGWMVAAGGAGWGYALSVVASAVAVIGLLKMDPSTFHRSQPVSRERGQVRAGLRYVRQHSELSRALALVLLVPLLGNTFYLTLPLLAATVFDVGPAGLGLLTAALAVGQIRGSMTAARRTGDTPPGAGMLVRAAVVMGALQGVVAVLSYFSGVFWVALVGLVPTGYAVGLFLSSASQRVFGLVEHKEMRGRVRGLYNLLLFGPGPVAALLVGVIGELAGTWVAMSVAGVFTVGTALAVHWWRASWSSRAQVVATAIAHPGRVVAAAVARSGGRSQSKVTVVLLATVVFVLVGSPVATAVVALALILGTHLWARGPPLLRVLGAALVLGAVVTLGRVAVGGSWAWAGPAVGGDHGSAWPGWAFLVGSAAAAAVWFGVTAFQAERRRAQWLRAAAALWLGHSPSVWVRIGFLAGALWLLRCDECAAGMAMALPPLGGGKGGAGRAAEEPLVLFELGTNRSEIQQLTRRKLLWNGFMRAARRYEARRDAAEEWPALVDLRARLEFALAAARARRDQPGSGVVAPTVSANNSLWRALHAVAAAGPVVTLPRVAGVLNQPKDRVAARLRMLEELGLVRLALTPKPIVAQITELGTAALVDPPAELLVAERLDDQERAVLRQRIAAIAARTRPTRTHVGPDLRLRREQRSSRTSPNPAPGAGTDDRPGGPLGLLSEEEVELAQQAFTTVRAASVGVPEDTVHSVRIRGPPPGLPAEEPFSPTPEAVADALRELEASPQQVARILGAWAFTWRDPDGTVVIVVFEHRRVVLQRIGLWEEVLEHERRHVNGGFASQEEHDTHVRDLTGRIDDALAAARGVAEPGQVAGPARPGPPGVASPIAPRGPPAELLERLQSTDGPGPEFWEHAGLVLELIVRGSVGRTGDPSGTALRRVTETLLAGGLQGGRELVDDYLAWIEQRLGSPAWLAAWWPTATLPGRIALGILVALVGAPGWLRELPSKRREPRDVTRLVRLWTDEALVEHAIALRDVFSSASVSGGSSRSEVYGSWLGLVHAAVVVATHADQQYSARVLDVLRTVPAAISAAGPQGNVVALLADAAAVVRMVGTGGEAPSMRVWTGPAPCLSADWSGTVTLYHGTTDAGAASIRSTGIQLSAQRDRTDFGTGFYTTRDQRDAQRMARKRVQTHGGVPVVLRFDVPVEVLYEMSGMTFPGPTREYRDFVRLMRTKGLRHTFDWVRGPVLYNVSDFLAGGEAHAAGEQVSFHTARAAQLLTAHLVEERTVRSAGRNRFVCPCGESHWGVHGAAGLLLWYRDAAGRDWFLLQQRSRSDYAGTWGLLGGAREPAETAEQTATREAREEGGLDPAAYTVLGSFLDDHGGWGFTTVLAAARSRDLAHRLNRETHRLEWIPRDQVHTLDLHPGLAETWNDLMRTLLEEPENDATPTQQPGSATARSPPEEDNRGGRANLPATVTLLALAATLAPLAPTPVTTAITVAAGVTIVIAFGVIGKWLARPLAAVLNRVMRGVRDLVRYLIDRIVAGGALSVSLWHHVQAPAPPRARNVVITVASVVALVPALLVLAVGSAAATPVDGAVGGGDAAPVVVGSPLEPVVIVLAPLAAAGAAAMAAGRRLRHDGAHSWGSRLQRVGAAVVGGAVLAALELGSKAVALAHLPAAAVVAHVRAPLVSSAVEAVVVLVVVVAAAVVAQSRWALLGWAAVLGGGLGNVLDLWGGGGAVDFIPIGLGQANVADVLLLTGGIILVGTAAAASARLQQTQDRSTRVTGAALRPIGRGLVSGVLTLLVARLLLGAGDLGADRHTLDWRIAETGIFFLLLAPVLTTAAVVAGLVASVRAHRAGARGDEPGARALRRGRDVPGEQDRRPAGGPASATALGLVAGLDPGMPSGLADTASSVSTAASTAVDRPTVLAVVIVVVVVVVVVVVRVLRAVGRAVERFRAWWDALVARLVRVAGKLLVGVAVGAVASGLGGSTAVGVLVLIGGVAIAVGHHAVRFVVDRYGIGAGESWAARGPPVRLVGLGITLGSFWWLRCPGCGEAAADTGQAPSAAGGGTGSATLLVAGLVVAGVVAGVVALAPLVRVGRVALQNLWQAGGIGRRLRVAGGRLGRSGTVSWLVLLAAAVIGFELAVAGGGLPVVLVGGLAAGLAWVLRRDVPPGLLQLAWAWSIRGPPWFRRLLVRLDGVLLWAVTPKGRWVLQVVFRGATGLALGAVLWQQHHDPGLTAATAAFGPWFASPGSGGEGERDEGGPQRRTRLEEWDPDLLQALAAGPVEEALLAALDAQGMGGSPMPVAAARWRELLAAGHRPMYRGFRGEQAEEEAEHFRSGEHPVLGLAANMTGTGSNFSTDPATASWYARIVSLPNPFRPMRRQPPAEVVLIGYLHRDAVVRVFSEAYQRQQSDVAAARRRGEHRLAELLADLGVWAALNGIDAVYQESGRFDRQYLVLNRGAVLVETTESMAALAGEERDWSGDRRVDCECGDEHFGAYGGAGLLVIHRAADGTVWLLLQRRSSANQHAGTLGPLGGARWLREPAIRTAMREAWEEAGLDPSTYAVRGVHVDDHGNWSYTTVLAETDSLITPQALSPESAEVTWVRIDDLAGLPLHPGFVASWPGVSATLLGRTDARTHVIGRGARQRR